MPILLSPSKMPVIADINMPKDLYVVIDEPGLLAGMCYPWSRLQFKTLASAGFTGVVCLADSVACYNPFPLKMLYCKQLEDLHYGNMPKDPERMEMMVREATGAVVNGLKNGEGIVVHCVGGIGRTGTVIGCVLREFGFSADDVIRYLDLINKSRGIRGWPESRWQADMVRKY